MRTEPDMKLIVNVSKEWAIGKGNELLFHFSKDMKFFKDHTTGNVIVMGRKTLDSLPGGRALPNRANIVLTKNVSFERSGVTVCHSADELKDVLKDYDSDSVYVIGGESIYKLLLPYCDTAYVTNTDAPAPDGADAFMTDLDSDTDWEILECSEEFTEKGLSFKFLTYKRKTS